jgi:hypothetical protein
MRTAVMKAISGYCQPLKPNSVARGVTKSTWFIISTQTNTKLQRLSLNRPRLFYADANQVASNVNRRVIFLCNGFWLLADGRELFCAASWKRTCLFNSSLDSEITFVMQSINSQDYTEFDDNEWGPVVHNLVMKRLSLWFWIEATSYVARISTRALKAASLSF